MGMLRSEDMSPSTSYGPVSPWTPCSNNSVGITCFNKTWENSHDFRSNSTDYYEVLGVDFEATDEEVRSAYRRLALRWHPDKHGGATSAREKFQQITEAYHVLSDPAKRKDYNENAEFEVDDFDVEEYLKRFKQMILSPNGLDKGIRQIIQ